MPGLHSVLTLLSLPTIGDEPEELSELELDKDLRLPLVCLWLLTAGNVLACCSFRSVLDIGSW